MTGPDKKKLYPNENIKTVCYRSQYLGSFRIYWTIPRNTSKCMGQNILRVVSIFRI